MNKLDRRSFLGWSATGVAGLLLPSISRPKVTTVLFGTGRRIVVPPIRQPVTEALFYSGPAPNVNAAPTGRLLARTLVDALWPARGKRIVLSNRDQVSLLVEGPIYQRVVVDGITVMQNDLIVEGEHPTGGTYMCKGLEARFR